MSDIYDEAVAFLTENPDRIYDAWNDPCISEGGILFSHVRKPGESTEGVGVCGCLTQIARGVSDDRWSITYVAQTKELTDAIRADIRIPVSPSYIMVDNLQVFAEWQRRIDKELGRETPRHI